MRPVTEEETCALEKFRKRVEGVLPKNEYFQRDDFLIRWLRARDMNLDRAEDILRHSMAWRKENEIDKLLDKGPDPELAKHFPFHIDGVDKLGRPVLTFDFGLWDIKTFVESDPEGVERFKMYFAYFMESAANELKRLTLELTERNKKQPCLQYLAIVDFTGFQFRQVMNVRAIQAVLKATGIFEGYYPETMGETLFINAPSFFPIFFGLITPILRGGTAKKIRIFNSDKGSWLPEVLKVVEPSQIRENFGGSKPRT